MIEIELPKDITKYEAKLAGVITKRQAICIGIASMLAFGAKTICDMFELYAIKQYAMMIACIIPLLFIVIQPYNMKLEDFLEQAFINNLLAPTKRKYMVENTFAKEYSEMLEEEHKIIGAYNKVYNIKVPQRRINDPKDKPRKKINKRNPELTGYL